MTPSLTSDLSVLVVEDDVEQLQLNQRLLEAEGFQTSGVTTARDAVCLLRERSFDALLCDFGLPDMNGGELLRYVRQIRPQTAFVMLTGYDDVATAVSSMRRGADEYLIKPAAANELGSKLLDAMQARRQLHENHKRAERAPIQGFLRGVQSLVTSLEAKDKYTRDHSRKVASIATQMAKTLPGLSRTQIGEIRVGALLHDIGKISVPLSILHKAGKLTEQEWEIIRRHPQEGARMVKPLARDFPEVHRIVLSEHERWDGNGYTQGLAGEAIPLGARLVMIADTYDAMCSNRSYRKALPKDEALRVIRDGAGGQFDPNLVPAFEGVVDSLPHPYDD